jgi:hypothetical protein
MNWLGEWSAFVFASGDLRSDSSLRGVGHHNRCRDMEQFRSNKSLQLTAGRCDQQI